jgi:hypothetical protein
MHLRIWRQRAALGVYRMGRVWTRTTWVPAGRCSWHLCCATVSMSAICQ